MLEELATLSRLSETLKRHKRSFLRAKYYRDETEMRRIRADIQRIRTIITVRQEFFDLSPAPELVTIDALLKRYGKPGTNRTTICSTGAE